MCGRCRNLHLLFSRDDRIRDLAGAGGKLGQRDFIGMPRIKR